MNGPPLQNKTIKSGLLSEDETSFILDSTLNDTHRFDPNIILFISNYMKCRHPKQAALESGLAWSAGRNLLERRDIAETIQKLTDKSLHKFGFDASQIVERVKEIADVNPFDIMDSNMVVLTKDQIPPEVQRTIKRFEVIETIGKDLNGMPVTTGRVVKIEFHDKMKANEMLGREKGVFKETKVVQHDMGDKMANVLLGAPQRALERIAQLRESNPQLQGPPLAIEHKDVTNDDVT
jgi:hypothetical protein